MEEMEGWQNASTAYLLRKVVHVMPSAPPSMINKSDVMKISQSRRVLTDSLEN
jgi:hypothetical protein